MLCWCTARAFEGAMAGCSFSIDAHDLTVERTRISHSVPDVCGTSNPNLFGRLLHLQRSRLVRDSLLTDVLQQFPCLYNSADTDSDPGATKLIKIETFTIAAIFTNWAYFS